MEFVGKDTILLVRHTAQHSTKLQSYHTVAFMAELETQISV
jgi:hypothetical protein